jgi:hypothetical protein
VLDGQHLQLCLRWIRILLSLMTAYLTDIAPPLSPVFIDFLARHFDGDGFGRCSWADQVTETLTDEHHDICALAQMRLERLLLHPGCGAAIERTYAWFRDLATSNVRGLQRFHEIARFIVVVGAPRTGGSYLTAELFAALGYNSSQVPSALAHDGFPGAEPFTLREPCNSWLSSLMAVGEYLTALELFFEWERHSRQFVVPKKATKAVYAGGLFRALFGKSAHYLVTLRHPIGSCVSTYEKSGGLPPHGKFAVRSVIERWIARDVLRAACEPVVIEDLDYFEAYIRYWEQFHIRLATSGLLTGRDCTIVPYGVQSYERTAASLHQQLASSRQPTRFVSPGPVIDRHPHWEARSECAIERVAQVWNLTGLTFPRSEIQRGY